MNFLLPCFPFVIEDNGGVQVPLLILITVHTMSVFLFHSHRLYKVYNKPVLRALVYFCVWLNLCLAFFEEPAVQGMTLPYWVSHLRLNHELFISSRI